ncbi:MAG: hypothetical protein PUB10_07770 [Clostridiales bacterium]|nr:hypothetical protein [Clostridiales bacterium]
MESGKELGFPAQEIYREIFEVAYFKKSIYFGSYKGLHFQIRKEGEELLVTAWPGPYIMEVTPEEDKKKKTVEFSEEGLKEASGWLAALHGEQKK